MRRKILNYFAKFFVGLLFLNKPNRINIAIVEHIKPKIEVPLKNTSLIFACPNSLSYWRYKTFFIKEPETLEWIDSFSENDILFDIGANVGLYSIYAAINKIRVFAFEPESLNYSLLNKNIFLNNLQENITSLNIAFSDSEKMDYLYIPNFLAGEALNNFGEPQNWKHNEFKYTFKQGVFSFTIDSFLEKNPDHFPNHIKIDVDGLESKIIKGAVNTLNDKRLKSLLIEINEELESDMDIIKNITSCGLKLLHKKHSQMFENSEYSTVYNYIFLR